MPEKPRTAAGYRIEYGALARRTCLYVATKLGDFANEIVVVGGLVPSLIVDQDHLPAGADAHPGTMDLDLGLAAMLLDSGRYRTLSDGLRRAGFSPDRNEEGNLTAQRWRVAGAESVTVDFLIPPSRSHDRGGTLRNLQPDFAAIIAPGLSVAFQDRLQVTLSGDSLLGERASRQVWVCGPGAFVVLKALAFDQRGENKGAFDLFYVLRNYGAGVRDTATRLAPLLADPSTSAALEILRRDFLDHDGPGPRRAAQFLTSGPDEAIQAVVAGLFDALLREI